MKRFSQFIIEAKETKASEQAKRLGLTGNGHGDWYNAQGEFVAKTVKGELKFFTKGQRIGKRDIPQSPKSKKEQDQVAATQVKQPQVQSQSSADTGTVDEPSSSGGEVLTVIFGRFNPPTKGHKELFSTAKRLSSGGEIRVYPSRVKDKKKNPLDPSKKIGFLKKMYPEFSDYIVDNKDMKTIFDVLSVATEDGFGTVNIVVSADRQSEIQNLANKYNGDMYQFDEIRVVPAGTSDAEKDASGVSSANMRKAALDGDFGKFKSGMPQKFGDDESRKLFNALRSSMGAKKITNENIELWEVSPSLDYRNLRENYINNKIFNLNEKIVNLNTGLVGKIIRRGTNYLICVTENNLMFKSWIKDVMEVKDIEVPSKGLGKLIKKSNKRKDLNVNGFVDKYDKTMGSCDEFIPQPYNNFTNKSGVEADQRLVGTDSYRKYAMRLNKSKKIDNFNPR